MIEIKQLHYDNKMIRDYGCFFLSILIESDCLFREKDVEDLYHKFIDEGWMRYDCFILNFSQICKYLNVKPKIGYTGYHFVNLSKNLDPITLKAPTYGKYVSYREII